MVNTGIDNAYRSTKFFDVFLQNEEYKERYHYYYNKLIEEYCYGGRMEETYNNIRNKIDTLVETDPNAMYTYEEYIKGAETFYEVLLLRAQSIRGQLAGTIPTTSDGQRGTDVSLVDASHINMSDMGQFMGGGRGGNFGKPNNDENLNKE